VEEVCPQGDTSVSENVSISKEKSSENFTNEEISSIEISASSEVDNKSCSNRAMRNNKRGKIILSVSSHEEPSVHEKVSQEKSSENSVNKESASEKISTSSEGDVKSRLTRGRRNNKRAQGIIAEGVCLEEETSVPGNVSKEKSLENVANEEISSIEISASSEEVDKSHSNRATRNNKRGKIILAEGVVNKENASEKICASSKEDVSSRFTRRRKKNKRESDVLTNEIFSQEETNVHENHSENVSKEESAQVKICASPVVDKSPLTLRGRNNKQTKDIHTEKEFPPEEIRFPENVSKEKRYENFTNKERLSIAISASSQVDNKSHSTRSKRNNKEANGILAKEASHEEASVHEKISQEKSASSRAGNGSRLARGRKNKNQIKDIPTEEIFSKESSVKISKEEISNDACTDSAPAKSYVSSEVDDKSRSTRSRRNNKGTKDLFSEETSVLVMISREEPLENVAKKESTSNVKDMSRSTRKRRGKQLDDIPTEVCSLGNEENMDTHGDVVETLHIPRSRRNHIEPTNENLKPKRGLHESSKEEISNKQMRLCKKRPKLVSIENRPSKQPTDIEATEKEIKPLISNEVDALQLTTEHFSSRTTSTTIIHGVDPQPLKRSSRRR
jgi:hypothetical protein